MFYFDRKVVQKNNNSVIWSIMSHFVTWIIWKEQNSRYEGDEISMVELKASALCSPFECCTMTKRGSFYCSSNSLVDFMDHKSLQLQSLGS